MIFCFRQKQDISKYRLSGHNILINDRSRILFFSMKNLVKKKTKINRAYRSKVALYQSCQCKKKNSGEGKGPQEFVCQG